MKTRQEIEERLSKLFNLAVETRDQAQAVIKEVQSMQRDLTKAALENLEKRSNR